MSLRQTLERYSLIADRVEATAAFQTGLALYAIVEL
jgi:hypothetical protein